MIFFLYFSKNELPYHRFAISVSKKIDKAVQRNYIKRVMRESFRKNRHLVEPGHDLWIVMKKKFSQENRSRVVRLFLNALIEIHYR
jgi:ribonuclease P protein component